MRYASKYIFLLTLAAVLLGGCGFPMAWDQEAPAENIPAARRISSKYIGNVLRSNLWDPGPKTLDHFAAYWNQVTPENSGKWKIVEPGYNEYDFSEVKKIYDYAVKRGYPFKYHCLLWGRNDSNPDWLKNLSEGTLRIKIKGFYSKVFQLFPKMDAIDVVNEPISDPFDYREALGGAGKTGWDWVISAFEIAKLDRDEIAPQCKLLINEYGIINSDPGNSMGKTRKYIELIDILNKRGLIDGIGVQCHTFDIGGNQSISTMKKVLDELGRFNLPVYLSEFDISNSDDDAQLDRYKAVFSELFEHPAVKGVTFWGYEQGEVWDDYPQIYLLKSDNTERPALTWLKENYLNPTSAVVCKKDYTSGAANNNHLFANTNGSVNLKAEGATFSDSQWRFIPRIGSPDIGRFKSVKTGLYLSIDSGSAEIPNVICEELNSSTNRQRWKVTRREGEDGIIVIMNMGCEKYLTAVVPANASSLPTLVCRNWVRTNSDAQRWRLK